MWGAYRLRKIREYHADIREWEHEKQVAKAAEAARNKKWLAKDEMRYLMKVGCMFPLVFTRFSCVVNFLVAGSLKLSNMCGNGKPSKNNLIR